MILLFPSLIAAPLLRLEETIKQLDPFVDGYHLDVMDFHFVPNLTWGPDVVNAIRTVTDKQLFVHLMVEFPEKYLPLLHLKDQDIISFHYESSSRFKAEELCITIASLGLIPSIALNPETPLEPLLGIPSFQNLLIMSVNPGFSGQQFIPSTLEKVAQSVLFRQHYHRSFTIAVDGGINEKNCAALVQAGAEQLAIATAIFQKPDPAKAIQQLRTLCRDT